MMGKVKLLMCRFPGGGHEHPDAADWYWQTANKAMADPRISEVLHWRLGDTPAPMNRNRAVRHAQEVQADVVLMLDCDMRPDCEPDGKPFWDAAFSFLWNHEAPCCIAAPYCNSRPERNVMVFRWCGQDNDYFLEAYGREEAAMLSGIQRAGALPTGVMLFDMRGVARLNPPYFYYEWKDETECDKATTEDVAFSRDLTFAGVPVYCAWDSWAGHWKSELIRKPEIQSQAALGRKVFKNLPQRIRERNTYTAMPQVCREVPANGVLAT